MAEIHDIQNLGYDYLWIADDSFTLDTEFLRNFCHILIEQRVDIKWSCLSRVRSLDISLVSLMHRAGCDKVFMGIESGNDRTLQLMKKNITTAEVRVAVQLFKQVGIKTAGFFIVGYPSETWASIEDTFRFALELDLDEVSFNVPYPLPGSALFSRITGFDPQNDWTIENETRFLFDSEFDATFLKARIQKFFDDKAKLTQTHQIPLLQIKSTVK